jgi:hypothetical protein
LHLTARASQLPARALQLLATTSQLPAVASQLQACASQLATRHYQNQSPRENIPTRLAPCDSPLQALTSPPCRYQYKNVRYSIRLRLGSSDSCSQLAPPYYHYPILNKNNRLHIGSSDSRSQLAHRRYNYPNPRNINRGGATKNHPALVAISTSAPWPVAEGPSGSFVAAAATTKARHKASIGTRRCSPTGDILLQPYNCIASNPPHHHLVP